MKTIFERQLLLNKKLNAVFGQEYREKMILACTDELHEALRETPWKSWKKNQSFNSDKYKEELVDALHFLVNLFIAEGMTDKDIYDIYTRKNEENIERWKNGY